MTNHCKVYLKHFGYTIADFIPCEVCGSKAIDIHHLYGRGKGMDVISNLMALCREHHSAAHTGISKSTMQKIHNEFLQKHENTYSV